MPRLGKVSGQIHKYQKKNVDYRQHVVSIPVLFRSTRQHFKTEIWLLSQLQELDPCAGKCDLLWDSACAVGMQKHEKIQYFIWILVQLEDAFTFFWTYLGFPEGSDFSRQKSAPIDQQHNALFIFHKKNKIIQILDKSFATTGRSRHGGLWKLGKWQWTVLCTGNQKV